jgi:protein-tyrosine-phosphatase
MPERTYSVLFLCTGNSARSILAEAILNRTGGERFRAYSAGSQPKGHVHPRTIELLQGLGHDTGKLRSKSWAEFARDGTPPIDFVFTVCDSAANEACPVWPGKPMTAHWGVPDPAEGSGSDAEIMQAFREAYRMLERRIALFTALPLDKLERMTTEARLREIGRTSEIAAAPQ